jgi:hypothetical protein
MMDTMMTTMTQCGTGQMHTAGGVIAMSTMAGLGVVTWLLLLAVGVLAALWLVRGLWPNVGDDSSAPAGA